MNRNTWDGEDARPRGRPRWLVPVLVVLAGAVVIVGGFALGSSKAGSADASKFCKAYDEAAPGIQAKIEGAGDATRAARTSSDLDRAKVRLDDARRDLEALAAVAPAEITSDLRVHFGLDREPGEADKPSDAARKEKAETRVDAFVRKRCKFEPVL